MAKLIKVRNILRRILKLQNGETVGRDLMFFIWNNSAANSSSWQGLQIDSRRGEKRVKKTWPNP